MSAETLVLAERGFPRMAHNEKNPPTLSGGSSGKEKDDKTDLVGGCPALSSRPYTHFLW